MDRHDALESHFGFMREVIALLRTPFIVVQDSLGADKDALDCPAVYDSVSWNLPHRRLLHLIYKAMGE